ncbi:M3 family oligoendopeptidase [Fictibacillus phosphorivorans]|uniref:M3 family oligoendopeptidase n=1 Tax=Fictibacillus phosphorivorans TaxID=1221500 RepID=UPI001293C128|nr:M3 family oligoendopeptidase [Fictibacillus phosphorivorans]MQR97260.1 M3 family oligoendopeptidase [Fictibacillus phosphorivorans]
MNEQKLNALKEEFENLVSVTITSLEDLKNFLSQQKFTYEKVEEEMLRHYIAFQCQSNDEDIKKQYEFDQQHIKPLFKKYQSQLDEKVLESPFMAELPDDEYGEYKKKLRTQFALFQEANLEIEKQEDALTNQYFEITGSLTSNWDEEEVTISELFVHIRDSKRDIREKAMKALYEPILKEEEKLQNILDELIQLRVKKAENAGLSGFNDYMFKKYNRFDYTPEDCTELAESIREHVLPITIQLQKEHKAEIGVDVYKPWDVQAEAIGLKPLQPVSSDVELINKSAKVLSEIDGTFGSLVHEMNEKKLFDLTSRKGKAQGGFCESLPVTGLPFIFMNMSNTDSDLVIFMHEMGHAIHDLLKSDQELYAYKQIPMESAELASMSMELFTMDRWDEFYKTEEELKRAKKDQLKGALMSLPYIMVIDQFQHWLYQYPNHTWEERTKKFGELKDRYDASIVDWNGYEEWKVKGWFYTLHIFEVPFYYVEYAISQLGAIQLYKNYKEDSEGTINKYKEALKLGSSKSLPEVYEAAGIKLDFSSKKIAELMEFVAEELNLLSVSN